MPYLRGTYAPKCIVGVIHGNTAPVDDPNRGKTGVVVQKLCPVFNGDWALQKQLVAHFQQRLATLCRQPLLDH